MVELTIFIQQWAIIKEEAPTKSLAPTLLSKDEINKMERMRTWTKSTLDWLKNVADLGGKATHYGVKMHNHFLHLKNEIEKVVGHVNIFLIFTISHAPS